MNNKIILSIALSLVMSSFAVVQAEDAAPAADTAAKATEATSPAPTADTPDANAVKDMMLSDSKKQDAKDAATQETATQEAPAQGDTTATATQETPAQDDTTQESAAPEAPAQASDSSVKSAAPALGEVDFSGVSSLRGENAINADALTTDNKQLPADRAPIMRNYFQQPPLIPHRIREYRITTNNNKCLSCHSWKNAAKARATKISQTHFADRDGNAHSTVAARRYFCTQCHVPQVDAKPLVENEFKPVDDLK